MGSGVCSRRQKGLLHTGFCLLALLGLASATYLYRYLQEKARTSEGQAHKLRQQQEALAAQLQVVYEHRSRLERSLQREKSEHKKTKEDYLVYKLEAQEALNKEKQDSMNRYGALSSQHKILQNQNDEIKKQLSELQVEHSNLKLENRRNIELHNQQMNQLHLEKENEILKLQDTIAKLREESKLLRKAHQDVHSRLVSAQAQMEEFRQLKDALQRIPSFKGGTSTPNLPDSKDLKALLAQSSLGNDRENGPGVMKTSQDQSNYTHALQNTRGATFGLGMKNNSHVTRTVNSLQGHKEDRKQAVPPQHPALHGGVTHGLPGAPEKNPPTVNVLVAKEQVPVHSWQDIVKKVNARMTKEEISNMDANIGLGKPQTYNSKVPNFFAERWENRTAQNNHRRPGADEAEMDAGVIDGEDGLLAQKQHVGQEALAPDEAPEDAADPAKDPNNQGEDEYEEAEIDRPEFEEKVAANKLLAQSKVRKEMLAPEIKSREEAEDRYQDDQEQEIEERGGELENGDDLELVQDEAEDKMDLKNRREGYY
ncbi:uncharacterized protein PAF06_016735 [Gastrophryne carolinensis]